MLKKRKQKPNKSNQIKLQNSSLFNSRGDKHGFFAGFCASNKTVKNKEKLMF